MIPAPPTNTMNTREVLEKALELTSGDRAKQHGDKYDNHANVAALWSAFLDVPVTPAQVALMMVLVKVARTKSGAHNTDDYVDAAGYAAIACEIARDNP